MKKIMYLLLLFVIGNVSAQTLHIYGGASHDVYLGCLNCDNYNLNSIWNEYGDYGNSYQYNSIWNEYGSYGSEYSDTSPWNKYANHPPVIVDKQGNFYGYFTVNQYNSKRADSDLVLYIYEYYEEIRNNVSKWYKRIFED
ncbi:hypothetical protein [Capnocytophaga canimorsus]|uniref:hypothetical protein n=1 Tax=Capnocytophaga canimorsus TaxID=28188 RepID=UPI001AD32FA6|nr:hypothetical protein [Capnocytophaga canimorsus]GIM59897.1 hypothetical protein CAPN007_21060 [Capnocytophaga canimorsus]